MTDQKIIKKYKNRRLYDLELSKYVTIDDLQSYVTNNVVFKVIDASNDSDITNAILLQIFVEMESHSTQFLSSEMLRQLIVLANHPMSTSFKTMLEQMMIMKNKLHTELVPSWGTQSEQMVNQWLDIWNLDKNK